MRGYQGWTAALLLVCFSPLSAAGREWRDDDSLRACRALAESAPARCEGPDVHPLCAHFYRQGLFSRSVLARSPDAANACEKMLAGEGGVIPAPVAAKACAVLVRRKPVAACAILRAEVKDTPSFSLKTCEDDFRMFLAVEGACAKMPKDAQDFCRGVAALRKVRTDLAACLREPYCAALADGGAAACAPIEIRIKENTR